MSNKQVERMRVFAVESPNALDMLENRTETQTLNAICNLLGHDFASTVVRSKEEFQTAVENYKHHSSGSSQRRTQAAALPSLGRSWERERNRAWFIFCALEIPGREAIGGCPKYEALRGPSNPLNLSLLCREPANYQVFCQRSQEAPYLWAGNVRPDDNWRHSLGDAVVAWTIFYHQIGNAVFTNRKDIMTIVDKIKLVGAGELKYFRWDEPEKKYKFDESEKKEHKYRSRKPRRPAAR